MKFIISLSIISFSFLASANNDLINEFQQEVSIEATYPGGPGKKGRKGKRINKKRKRKCGKWSRKSYAG